MTYRIEAENEDITLGGYPFEAVSIAEHTFQNVVIKHPMEEGFEIADHISTVNRKFRVTLTLFTGRSRKGEYAWRDQQLSYLKYLYENKYAVPFESTVVGYIDNVVISNMTVSTSNKSANTYDVTLELEQLRVAIPLEETLYLITDKDGTVYSNIPNDLGSKPIPTDLVAPPWEDEDDKSIWDILLDGFKSVGRLLGLGGEEAPSVWRKFPIDPGNEHVVFETNVAYVDYICELRYSEDTKIPHLKITRKSDKKVVLNSEMINKTTYVIMHDDIDKRWVLYCKSNSPESPDYRITTALEEAEVEEE